MEQEKHKSPLQSESLISRRSLLSRSVAGIALGFINQLFPLGCFPLLINRADVLSLPTRFRSNVIIRWGDPIIPGGNQFDPLGQDPIRQASQFGYNCDFVAFFPLQESQQSNRGLLVVNHEYTNATLMFPGIDIHAQRKSRWMVETEWEAHGMSVVEVQQTDGRQWSYVPHSRLNRRITVRTPLRLSGPAAGHLWLKTSYDPTGTVVQGTLDNCGGGITPWGTVLSCEENFHYRFGGNLDIIENDAIQSIHRRYTVKDLYGWGDYDDRFDVVKEPHEPLRFGWVVELDPYDPDSMPVKRTALGRLKHEFAVVVVGDQRQVVVYTNDDEEFEYVYKFVSASYYDPQDKHGNKDLLDRGTLYVARFNDDGTGEWLPLTYGSGPLTPHNGFHSQAEVLINTRGAADLLAATPMDRPEGLAVNPKTGKIYAVMTENLNRVKEQAHGPNPRVRNTFGHIIELIEQQGDHASTRFTWKLFIACGDPTNSDHQAYYPHPKNSHWFVRPDNITVDDSGFLWIATDGQMDWKNSADGLFVVGTEGASRGMVKPFLTAPMSSEPTGMAMSPDQRTMFVSIQHPGQSETSSFKNPVSRWPDYKNDIPPRPSVIAIYKEDGSPISGRDVLG